MGNQFLRKIVTSLILLLLFLSLVSCGDFVGLKDDDTDIGRTERMEIFLSEDDLYRLYSSVSTDQYTPCRVDYESWRGEADIKVRGYTSRMHDKKSFQLKIDGRKYVLERGHSSGGIGNRLAMRAYQLAGLEACDTRSVGLFINDEYLGCYNLIFYYDENILGGELYKCYFHEYNDMSLNHPLRGWSEKKFPKDDDFSNLENLISAMLTLSDADWREYVLSMVDIEKFAAYLAVHDCLRVEDTFRTNFYIAVGRKFYFLPWDNESCMGYNSSGYELGGDNQLTRRLVSVSEVKEAYNRKVQELFIDGGIVGQLCSEAIRMFDEAEDAMRHDPNYSFEDFSAAKADILLFLSRSDLWTKI